MGIYLIYHTHRAIVVAWHTLRFLDSGASGVVMNGCPATSARSRASAPSERVRIGPAPANRPSRVPALRFESRPSLSLDGSNTLRLLSDCRVTPNPLSY